MVDVSQFFRKCAMAASSPELLVFEALSAATSADHEVVRKAERQLAEWESHAGFFPTVARFCVVMTRAEAEPQDVNVRWMAAVYLKNGVNKYWRRNMRNELPAEEKAQIREVLLANFAQEPVLQVALQVAVLISRIARIDCPRDWPELIPALLKRLHESAEQMNAGQQNQHQHRSELLVLHYVVKALASRRMMSEKRMFEELATNIFAFVQDLWNLLTSRFFQELKQAPESALPTLERALLSLRILRKLSTYGFSKPHLNESCMRFLEQLFPRITQCLECRYELSRLGETTLVTVMEKFILKQIKALNEFQDMHSASFITFVPTALEFSFNHVFDEGARFIFTNDVINFGNFAIQCINLMKGIMVCSIYAPIKQREEDGPVNDLPIVLSDFFTNERLCYMAEKLITHYFLLTQMELEAWMDDPEGFAQDDVGDSWKYSLRPCVETLFFTCFSHFQNQMTSEVSKYIRKAQQIPLSANSSLKDILLKDAIYNAAGLSAFHFFNDIDFDEWFSKQLLDELRIETDNFRILRRRIIWLVSKWATVKFSSSLAPVAYEVCLHLLRPSEDMSIRLASSKTLSTLITGFEFAPVPFLPYLEPTLNSLFVLLQEAKECDTKMNVLNIMAQIVETMGEHIEQQADNLIAYLPLLWRESENYNMLRCAIISTLQLAVKSMADIPETMKPFLYTVIKFSTDLNDPSHIYLMEEALILWQAFVENSTVLTPQLLDLCKNLLPIIEMTTENLRIVLVLIQAYILLDARAYLEPYGRQFVDLCVRMFDDIRPEGIALMLKVFETCLKSDANYGLDLIRPSLPYIFKQVYVNKEFPMLMSMYLMIIARVLLINQTVFTTVVQELQLPNAVETILDVWITKMPLVTEVEKRKLFSLAFGSIFTNNTVLLERLPGMMQNISETLNEIMAEEDEGADQKENAVVKYCDSLVFVDEHDLGTGSYDTMDDFDYKTHHYDRCRQLSLKDAVHQIALPDYVEWRLNALRTEMGDTAYQHLMLTAISPSVLEKLSKFVKLNVSLPM